MIKCKLILAPLLFFILFNAKAQTKQEREYRIDRDALPEQCLILLQDYLSNTKRLRFYEEHDGEKASYEIKFKKDKLFYSIEFDGNGTLEDVEFIIKPQDIPTDVYESITSYFREKHHKYRIKKIQQQYLNKSGNEQLVLKNAFQNLILADINYEIIITTKDKGGFSEYEITFDSAGNHLLTRKAVNSNYDHVLYH